MASIFPASIRDTPDALSMSTILLVVLILLLFGAVPWGGYHSYGYGPAGGLGLVLVIVLVLVLLGRL